MDTICAGIPRKPFNLARGVLYYCMSNTSDLATSVAGTILEYALLSTLETGSALKRRGEATHVLYFCCPTCLGSESSELWVWRTSVDTQTVTLDCACQRCLDIVLSQAEDTGMRVYRTKMADKWMKIDV